MSAADAAVLRRAALILEHRSKRPGSWFLRVMTKFLRNVADDVERGIL